MGLLLVVSIGATSCPCRGADENLRDLIATASSCSDEALAARVSASCEAPDMLASLALGDCKSRGDAVAKTAVGPAPQGRGAALNQYRRSLKTYVDALAFEYVRAAELKAIDLRRDVGNCASEQP